LGGNRLAHRDPQAQFRRPVSLSGGHADRHRKPPYAEPGWGTAAVELFWQRRYEDHRLSKGSGDICQMAETCVIFDLDGALVDSEFLCKQAFVDLLPEIDEPAKKLVHRYRGKKLSVILADLEERIGRKLPDTSETTYRERVSGLFTLSPKPMPGVVEMLESLDRPKCIASSGPPQKIAQVLKSSGLAANFGSNLYS